MKSYPFIEKYNLILRKGVFFVQKYTPWLMTNFILSLQKNKIVFEKACFSVIKYRDYLSDCNLIVLYINICFA